MSARSIAFLFAVFLAVLPAAASAQGALFDEGYKAYQAKDYNMTLYYWQPLAERDDPRAQFNLGILYLYGRGVNADPAQALMWFLLARDNHMAEAANAIDQLEQKMDPEDLHEGLRLRDEWVRAHRP